MRNVSLVLILSFLAALTSACDHGAAPPAQTPAPTPASAPAAGDDAKCTVPPDASSGKPTCPSGCVYDPQTKKCGPDRGGGKVYD
jgi:hypothetical protein